MLDAIENLVRYLKARHIGELIIFGLSVLLLSWCVAIALMSVQGPQTLSGLENSIRYFLQWLLGMVVFIFMFVLSLTLYVKRWGKGGIILLAIGFQIGSLILLLVNYPLK